LLVLHSCAQNKKKPVVGCHNRFFRHFVVLSAQYLCPRLWQEQAQGAGKVGKGDWTMRKIKLTRANKSILLKALAPYYYREKALGHSTEKPGRLILKINSLPADKKATFSTEEIRLMCTTVNQLRNERLSKGQYTDAADDMLLKLF
jgi:hypothetical protein